MWYRNHPSASQYETVGILGGGTAGYLTALSLKASRPELNVTVLESSKIPVIGVGEATTSEIVPYLHRILDLDIVEFYREVKPTWKLGIKFIWGQPGDYSFYFPFDTGHPLEAWLYEGHLRNATLLSVLMGHEKGLVIPKNASGGFSLISRSPYAYHLDNQRFVRYLHTQAERAGVNLIDCEVVDARLNERGDEIAALLTSDSAAYSYDLYIDCSGFRSVLLEQKLGSKFISYSDSLYTDSAVVAAAPHDGLLKPYTTAETMRNGWCWNTPQVEADHCGYVFSSAFCNDAEAAAEMQDRYPRMGDHRFVRFRPGRHEQFWKGNVIAIGNAYGFVEPLESTGIQMILTENLSLIRHFPRLKSESKCKEELNQYVAGKWDYLRWFLAIHYKFNAMLDTPFWKHCRRDTNISGAQEPLQRFQKAAPLSYGRPAGSGGVPRPAFDDFGYDALLLGQAVPATYVDTRATREAYFGRLRGYEWIAGMALSHQDSLKILVEQGEDILSNHIDDDNGWVAIFEKDLWQRG